MKFCIRNLLYGILCLLVTVYSPCVFAEKICCSEINVETYISADDNTDFFTNAEVVEKGLAITGVRSSTDQYGEIVYTPDENDAFLAVNILRHNIKPYDNIIIEVDYADTDHDNQSWLCIKYKGSDGKIKYTKPIGMKNSGKSIVTQQFLIQDIVFDDYFSGYDFQVVNFINNSKWLYAKEPAFIKSVRTYTCGTTSPVQISIETDNKGNIFYDEDVVDFEVSLKNRSVFPVDFKAYYNIYKIEPDGNETLYKSQAIQYNIDSWDAENAVLEFDVPEYALYSLDIILEGTCNSQIVETQYETRFSKCVLNDKVNASFGVTTTGGNMDLIRAAGIGTVRNGYNLPYEQGSSYNPPKDWSDYLKIAVNNDVETTVSIILANGKSLPPEGAYDDIYNCVYNFLTDKKYIGNIDKISIGNEPEARIYLDDISISTDTERYEKLGRRYGITASAAAKAVHDSGLDVKLSAFETCMAHEKSVSPSFTRENLYDFYTAALEAMTEKGVIEYFDAYTCHAYMGFFTEDVYKSNITYIRNILDAYNYGGGNYEIWTTEAGYSSANIRYYANVLYGDEYSKAKKIIKQYTVMKSDRFDGTYCFYNFVDSGIPESVAEARFGMLESGSTYNDVPLAAKYTYLAVAAINKLIEDSTSCTEVVNADGVAGYMYKGSKRDVYCYWSSDENKKLVEMPFDVKTAVFYDIFGNEISVEISDENCIMLNNDILYAVVGEPYTISKIRIDKSILNIHGTIESKKKDKKVSLIVLEEGADIKKDVPTGVKFIKQSTTDENGEFWFSAYVGENENGFEAYVFSEDSYSPIKLSFFCDKYNYDVSLRSGIFRISSLDYGLFNEKDSSIRLKYNSSDEYEQNSTLYYAMYNDNYLTSVGIFPVKNTDNKTLWSYDTSVAEDIEYDNIKIFLWDSNDGMMPLIDVTEIK